LPVLSRIFHSGVMLEVFMILRVLSRIGLEQDQKLIRGRWGEREQSVREIYFYRK
jgi:hypothetical protein